MSSHPFKNMIVYRAYPVGDGDKDQRVIDLILERFNGPDFEMREALDPSGGQWSASGFSIASEDQFLHDLDGSGLMVCVQFNERILPGKVRDEHLKKAIARLEEQQGHKASKKDYASMRDQIEFELLPKAFIRRLRVPIIITPEDHVLVFTSSVKKASEAIACLWGALNGEMSVEIYPMAVNKAPTAWLTGLANKAGDEEYGLLEPRNSAVLKGAEKRTVRIKDLDVAGHTAQQLITDGWDVVDLGITFLDDEEDDARMTFLLNDKLVFRGCSIPNVSIGASKGDKVIDFHSFAYLMTRTLRDLIEATIDELGGEKLLTPGTPQTPAADDEEI